jgi:hypothetical protein
MQGGLAPPIPNVWISRPEELFHSPGITVNACHMKGSIPNFVYEFGFYGIRDGTAISTFPAQFRSRSNAQRKWVKNKVEESEQ